MYIYVCKHLVRSADLIEISVCANKPKKILLNSATIIPANYFSYFGSMHVHYLRSRVGCHCIHIYIGTFTYMSHGYIREKTE